jgi:glycosyltransferase involved in cell wall biosynthesis
MDLYPDVPVACGVMDQGSLTTKFFDALNTRLIRSSTRAVVLGRCMADRLTAKGVPPDALAFVPPWADAREVYPLPRDENPFRTEWGLGAAFVVMYSGNFGLGHDLATPCRAALALRERANLTFLFVGGGKRKDEVEAFALAHPEARLHVHPYQPRERLHASLGVADVHIISLEERALGAMIPSKLFGIMAASRPAVFIGPGSSEIARIILEIGCGLVVAPGDERALAAAIARLADNPDEAAAMGRRGRDALERVYDRPLACARLEALLVEAAGLGDAASSAEPRSNRASSRGA